MLGEAQPHYCRLTLTALVFHNSCPNGAHVRARLVPIVCVLECPELTSTAVRSPRHPSNDADVLPVSRSCERELRAVFQLSEPTEEPPDRRPALRLTYAQKLRAGVEV